MTSESAEAVFKKKRERRRQLAKLPFEKKIEIVVELQKAAAGICKDPHRKPWVLWASAGSCFLPTSFFRLHPAKVGLRT